MEPWQTVLDSELETKAKAVALFLAFLQVVLVAGLWMAVSLLWRRKK